MQIDVSTPALLFPAISLLFLSYTNRFLHLSALIRNLHKDWQERHEHLLLKQIDNIRRRLVLIRLMQMFGAFSLLLCVISMVSIVAERDALGFYTFAIALISMALSLIMLIREIMMSGGALEILLRAMEQDRP
ncbi:MAG: DUF2721 domain-containing protein [Verrucomicrobiota bacterium JB023]|nr:DUF2721 domain-containing protein [Verrucomicrobiota bacterium JB023]